MHIQYHQSIKKNNKNTNQNRKTTSGFTTYITVHTSSYTAISMANCNTVECIQFPPNINYKDTLESLYSDCLANTISSL